MQLESAVRVLSVAGIKPPEGPGVQVNVGIMSSIGREFLDRTGHTLRTKEDRAEYERLNAQGVFASDGWPGYILDYSPQDDSPEQVPHEP